MPPPLDLPRELEHFWGRKVWHATPAGLRRTGEWPVFVKPGTEARTFEGRVLRGEPDLDRLLPLREDSDLEAQEVVPFASEWRAFVIRGAVQGLCHCAGDPLALPAANAIRMTVGGYRGAPAGYAADFGVTADGRTILVEANDGFSVGCGGLMADLHARLLAARCDQLTAPA